jgi:hypothetical protein
MAIIGSISTVAPGVNNNQSRPLRGARVILDLENADISTGITTRIPQTKNTGPSGALFSRMPSSSMVGKYTFAADPKPNDRAGSYSGKKRTKNIIHSHRGTSAQFNFTYQKRNVSTPPVAAEIVRNGNKKTSVLKSEFKSRRGGVIRPMLPLVCRQTVAG